MSKKLLIIGPFPKENKGLNGQSIANQTIYEGLKEKYDVSIINTLKELEFSDKSKQGQFRLIKFLKISISMFFDVLKMTFHRYDIVYTTPGQSFLGFMRFFTYFVISFIKKIPCYIHIHGGAFRKMYDQQSPRKKKIINYVLKRISGVIVLGNSLKYMFEGLVEESKIFVCENGIQDDVLATAEEIKIKESKFDNKKIFKVLYLSNLMTEKGVLDILKIIDKFYKDDSNIEFNFAGAMEPTIKDEIESYFNKYPQKINYYGIVDGEKKKKLLLENDIFVLPTYYTNEGQPISILEAYANGCSVVTTYQGGIKDIFTDKVNGVLCKAKDISSLYEAVEKVKTKKNYIMCNYKLVLDKFTKNHFVERIEKVLIEG